MRFLRLKNPDPQPAPADEALTFTIADVADARPGASWVGAVSLDRRRESGRGDRAGRPAFTSPARRATWPVGRWAPRGGGPTPDAVAAADLNYDFRIDLALAGAGGLCLLRQDDAGRFTDVTAAAKLPPTLLRAPASGVWPADIDTDGDLDLVLAPRDGHPIVLRNNGDGTFTPRDLFPGVTARARLRLGGSRRRRRARRRVPGRRRARPRVRQPARRAVPRGDAAADVRARGGDRARRRPSGDSLFDLLVLARDGPIAPRSRAAIGRNVDARPPSRGSIRRGVGAGRRAAAHRRSRQQRRRRSDRRRPDQRARAARRARRLVHAADGDACRSACRRSADLDGDGRLELIGVDRRRTAGPRRRARGAKLSLAGRSARAPRRRPAISASTRSASAARSSCDPACTCRSRSSRRRSCTSASARRPAPRSSRITWPNGVLQAEFDTKADQTVDGDAAPEGIVPVAVRVERTRDVVRDRPAVALAARAAHQRAGDGRRADDRGLGQGPRRSARAARRRLRSAHHRGAVGDALLRSRRRCWSSIIPTDTEIFVDERFAVPPPKLRGHRHRAGPAVRVGARRSRRRRLGPRRARDDSRYRRLRRPRRRIRASRARTSSRWSCRTRRRGPGRSGSSRRAGSIRPTARSTSRSARARTTRREGLSLQVADAAGRFRDVRTGLGFPVGQGQDDPRGSDGTSSARRGPRRLRLATNLEIFWDRLGWAVGRPGRRDRSRAGSSCVGADLAYRGYSVTEQPTPERARAPALHARGHRRRGGAISRATTRGSATCASCCAAWTIATSS